MSVSTTCKGCGVEFTAQDGDGLADQMLEHINAAHTHSPTREQVLAIIRKRLEAQR